MIFNNVRLLGYSHENSFFGENSFIFSSKKNIRLQGYILDLTNFNGVSNIFTEVQNLTIGAKDFQEIIINGENYGVGKVTSFSVSAGNWVRTTEYEANIQVLSEMPISNIDSQEFDSLDLNDKKLELLKNFSESFNLDFDVQNKILGGQHQIEIEYDANNKNINLIKLAQSLAVELLKTLPSNLYEGNYTARTNYQVYNTESYDVTNGKAGFSRNFSYSTENTNKPYSIVRNNSITLNEEGIATVSENCEIKGIGGTSASLYSDALSGLNQEIVGAYSRCVDFFNTYKIKFNISQNLNSQFLNKNIKINKFTGVINYEVSFDNDKKNQDPNYSWEYSLTLDRGTDGIWTISEDGQIIGNGTPGNTGSKYQKAESGWNIVKNNILSRIQSFYNSEASIKPNSPVLKNISQSINREKYNGQISYGYNYTDDQTIIENDPDGVKKILIEKSDTNLSPIIKNFIIPNNTHTLVQNRSLKQQGTYTVSVKMDIGCVSGVFDGSKFINRLQTLATFGSRATDNFEPLDPQDYYLESATFTSDEIEQNVSYEAVYKYS